MPTEIEIKLAVTSHEAVRTTLKHLGAKPLGLTHETNTFFDTEDATLRSTDRGLRIRRNTRPSGETLIVTYKGPKLSPATPKKPTLTAVAPHPQSLKSREEIEVPVGDHNALVALFDRLGYHVTLSFEKHRETWQLGTCTVELDTLPRSIAGGTFLEIEGPTDSAVHHALAQLGLQNQPPIKESYIQLVSTWAQTHTPTSKHIRFEP